MNHDTQTDTRRQQEKPVKQSWQEPTITLLSSKNTFGKYTSIFESTDYNTNGPS